jgi:hypothetical protein
MHPTLRRASILIVATGVAFSGSILATDNAFIRASEGILMSRNMDIKDRVAAADSLARYEPRAAVPILIVALNETSEPVRRAAARGLWTIAQKENPEEAASAQTAIPALRIALGDSSVSVAMNAAGRSNGSASRSLHWPKFAAKRSAHPGPTGTSASSRRAD